jgi:lipid II:glycine glycyltransferase (peptidoglycan interpeptide bridge formation enzyme)
VVQTVRSDRLRIGWDDRVLATHSVPHFMQSSTWEAVRSNGPWHVARRTLGIERDHPVLVFERLADGFGTLQHLPRVSGITADDLPALTDRIRAERGTAFATKIEVCQPRDDLLLSAFGADGWLPTHASQYRYTVVVDIAGSEDDILARMKKRARSEIRSAERNGVSVERADITEANVRTMLDLVRETEARSGAFFRPSGYLTHVWSTFVKDGRGCLYFARHDGRAVAGAFIIFYGPNAWFKDGASRRDQRQLMASRLLQWRIMQDLAAMGIERYELGHVPPPDEPDAPGRGILTFKSAFSHEILEYLPAFQLSHEEGAEAWRRGESAFLAEYRRRTHDDWY